MGSGGPALPAHPPVLREHVQEGRGLAGQPGADRSGSPQLRHPALHPEPCLPPLQIGVSWP